MIEFKGCPKCQGDLKPEKDRYGTFLTCLQCGYVKELGVTTIEEGPRERKTAGTR